MARTRVNPIVILIVGCICLVFLAPTLLQNLQGTSLNIAVNSELTVQAEFRAFQLTQTTVTTGVGPDIGIDWEGLRTWPHALKGHRAEIVACTAYMMGKIGATEAWQSDRPVTTQGNVALVLRRNLNDITTDLIAAGIGGPCAVFGTDMAEGILKSEFGDSALLKLSEYEAVVVFAIEEKMIYDKIMGRSTPTQVLAPISLYLVPTRNWNMWRCDWRLTHRIYPVKGYFPCAIP